MADTVYNPALLSLKKIQNKGTNAESVYNQNRRLILQLIRNQGIISRKDLAEKSGLQLATITLIIDEFIQKGIIQPTGFIEGDRGRKIMGFGLTSGKFCTIVAKISVSYVSVAAYDINNENLVVHKYFMDTQENLQKTCNFLIEEIKKIEKNLQDRIVLGIGVGVEGPFIMKDGYYKYPDEKQPGGFFDIGRYLSDKHGHPVIVNKQNNFAVYNLWMENNQGRNLGIFVNISVTYTIECGIMVNGEIINGCNGSSGLLGNIILGVSNQGEPASLNDLCSTKATLRRVSNLLDAYPKSVLFGKGEILNIRDVIRAFHEGDELATAVFSEAAVYLGRIVAHIVNILNPDYILIGDEMPHSEKMYEMIENEAKKYISSSTCLNMHKLILDYEHHRQTQIDPALKGASRYIMDAYIQSMDFASVDNRIFR